MENKKQYKLKDIYEEAIIIGYFDTMQEVKKACKEWELETDNECCFELRKLNENNKYTIVKEWNY